METADTSKNSGTPEEKYSQYSFWYSLDYFTKGVEREIFNAKYPKTRDFNSNVCWRSPKNRKTLSGITLNDRGRVLDINIAPRIFGFPVRLLKLRGYIDTIKFNSKRERFYLTFCYGPKYITKPTEEKIIRPDIRKYFDTDFKIFETPETIGQIRIPVKATMPGGEEKDKTFRLPNYLFISIPDES